MHLWIRFEGPIVPSDTWTIVRRTTLESSQPRNMLCYMIVILSRFFKTDVKFRFERPMIEDQQSVRGTNCYLLHVSGNKE